MEGPSSFRRGGKAPSCNSRGREDPFAEKEDCPSHASETTETGKGLLASWGTRNANVDWSKFYDDADLRRVGLPDLSIRAKNAIGWRAGRQIVELAERAPVMASPAAFQSFRRSMGWAFRVIVYGRRVLSGGSCRSTEGKLLPGRSRISKWSTPAVQQLGADSRRALLTHHERPRGSGNWPSNTPARRSHSVRATNRGRSALPGAGSSPMTINHCSAGQGTRGWSAVSSPMSAVDLDALPFPVQRGSSPHRTVC